MGVTGSDEGLQVGAPQPLVAAIDLQGAGGDCGDSGGGGELRAGQQFHGDGLDARDWKYRFWRRASKSALSRLVVSWTPRKLARWLVDSTERSLSKTNRKHKRHIPEEVLRAYAEERLAEGHDALLVGHFHEEHRWPVDGGEVWLLEAWYDSRRVEWLPERPPEEASREATDEASRGGGAAAP